MKDSIKREQSQAGLSFAERKNFRPKVKRNKLLLLLVLLMTAATGAWAQEQWDVVWDFTAWSTETVTALKADAAASKLEGWSDVEKQADAEAGADPTEAAKDNCFWFAGTVNEDGSLSANGAVIKELKGLKFNSDYAAQRKLAIAVNYPSTSLGDYAGGAYLWLGGKNQTCFTIPGVKAGSKITIEVESNKPSDGRGIGLYKNSYAAENLIGEQFKPTAKEAKTWEIAEDCDVVVWNTNNCHIYTIKVKAPAAATYTVSVKDGVKDADKWTITPNPAEEGQTVTLQYNGRLKVKGVKATSDAEAPAAPIEVLTYSFDDASHPSGLTAGSRVSFDYSRTSVITNSKFLNAYNNENGDPGATTVSLGDTDLSGETWTLSFEWAACGGCNSKPDHTTLKAGDATLFDLNGNSNWNTTVTIIYTGSDGSKTLPVPGCDKNIRFTAAVGDQYNTTTYWHHIVVTGSAEGVKMTITNSSTGAAVVEDVVLSETNVNPTSLIIEPSCGGGIGIDALSLTYEPAPAEASNPAPTSASISGYTGGAFAWTGDATTASDFSMNLFNANDAISLLSEKNANVKFTTTAGGASATFSGSATDDSKFYAVYPYTDGLTLSGDVISGIVIPTSQWNSNWGNGGSAYSGWDPKAPIAYATTTGSSLTFHNACAILKVTITGAGTWAIFTISANEPLAGTFSLDTSTGTLTPISGSTTVAVGTDFSYTNCFDTLGNKTAYIAIAPGTYTNFVLYLLNEDGDDKSQTKSGSVTFEAGKIYDLGSYNVDNF